MTPDLQSVSTMSVSQTVSGKESTQEDCVCSKVEFWVGGSTLPALKAFLCCWVTQSQVFSITSKMLGTCRCFAYLKVSVCMCVPCVRLNRVNQAYHVFC